MIINEGVVQDCCTDCANLTAMDVHDVYFDKPGNHHGLFDSAGNPVFVSTKAQKVNELKKRGLREAGDRVRGATKFDPISYRHAMKSLEKGAQK